MKATNKVLVSVALVVLVGIAAGFAVNIQGAIVNAMTGFQFNGMAPNNHVLCGNGTSYVDAVSCGTVANPNYQTMQSNGAPLTARADLNFDTNFALSDTAPSTTVTLASSISSTSANSLAVGGVSIGGLCQSGGNNCPLRSGTLTDATSLRSFGTVFTNTNSTVMYVSGFGLSTLAGHTSSIQCVVNGIVVWAAQYNATVAGGPDGFACMVPAGGAYEVTVAGAGTTVTLGSWTEFVF